MYTDEQRAEFKAKFAQKRLYQVALSVPLGGAVILLFLGYRYGADLPTMAFGTACLLLPAATFYWLNWRCPACEKYLGKDLRPRHCPNCGVALG